MTLNDAVAALKAHARQLEAVQTIAAAISDVSAIDQLTDEAEQRRVARQAEVDAAHARLVDIEGALKAAQAKVLAANAQSVAIIEDAKLKAVSIVEKAKADAVSAAETAATNATANLKRINADVDRTQNQLTQMLASLDEVNASHAAKAVELAEVEKRIASAKALMAGFVG
jgi:chromosome segregation ATPase